MQKLRAYFSHARSYLKAHRAARIAVIAAAALLALLLLLHPHGTQTYLILGMDNYGSLNDVGRSDVMMLVQLNFDREKIHAVTFARDMVLPTEKGGSAKINTLVRSSGEDALVAALEKHFGLKIDGWFRINFSSVISIVDAIGGAQVELTQAEANYIDRTAGTYPDSPLREGLCRLNGAQALTYARCRKLDNDIGRGNRQSKLFSALVQATKRMTAAHVFSLVGEMNHAWRSSLSGGEQAALVLRALWMRGANVTRVAVPFDGYWHYGKSSVEPDLPANVRLLHEALGLPAPAEPNTTK